MKLLLREMISIADSINVQEFKFMWLFMLQSFKIGYNVAFIASPIEIRINIVLA